MSVSVDNQDHTFLTKNSKTLLSRKQPLPPTIGISVACMTHQLFGVLAHRKHLATPGYALHPSGIWDITLSEIFTLECDWRSRICTWRHGAQLIPVRKQHLSRDVERSFAKGLTPARPHESTRPNTTRLLKTFGYVWHVSAHAIWS